MPRPFFQIGTPSKQQPKTVKDILWGRDLGVFCWRRISPGRRRDIIEVARGECGHGGRCTPSVKETSHDRESTRQGPCNSSHLFASPPYRRWIKDATCPHRVIARVPSSKCRSLWGKRSAA